MNSVGSIWRKWDLHIHTPASFHWPGKPLDQQTPTEREATCKATKRNQFRPAMLRVGFLGGFEAHVEKFKSSRPFCTSRSISNDSNGKRLYQAIVSGQYGRRGRLE
jgi:hypothetical protein